MQESMQLLYEVFVTALNWKQQPELDMLWSPSQNALHDSTNTNRTPCPKSSCFGPSGFGGIWVLTEPQQMPCSGTQESSFLACDCLYCMWVKQERKGLVQVVIWNQLLKSTQVRSQIWQIRSPVEMSVKVCCKGFSYATDAAVPGDA